MKFVSIWTLKTFMHALHIIDGASKKLKKLLERTYVYNKVYDNFTLCPSNKAKVKKQQTAHFERHCRRVLHNSELKEDATLEDKVIACKRKGFLFLPSVQFNKLIMHLRYKKKYQIPLQRYYNFKIPSLKPLKYAEIRQEVHIANYFNSTKHNLSFDLSVNSNDARITFDSDVISSPILELRTGQPNLVQPIIHNEPVILPIPDELLPYVPTEPIYKDGVTSAYLTKKEWRTLKPLIVGSKNWIKAIRSIKTLADQEKEREVRKQEMRRKWEVDDNEFASLYDNWFYALCHHQNTCHEYFAYLSTSPAPSASPTPSSKKKGKQKVKDTSNNSSFNHNHLMELKETLDDSNLHLAITKRDHELYYPDFYSKLPRRECK
ncbi:unnamed protein product [Rhizophagus irregularis]|nr:unnamed protein product [Rhizophagus irregularis]